MGITWVDQIEKMIVEAREKIGLIMEKLDDYKSSAYAEISRRQEEALSEISQKRAILETETAKLNELRGQIGDESDSVKREKEECQKILTELESRKAQMSNWNTELTKREKDLQNLRNSLKEEGIRINKLNTDTQSLIESLK